MDTLVPGWTRRGELHPAQPPSDRADGDLGLHPREVLPQAGVNSGAESQVTVVPTADVQPVRIGELDRVAVGGGDQDEDLLTAPDELVAERDVLECQPSEGLDRRVVAEELFDRAPDQLGVLPQPTEFVGMAEERQHAVADEPDRRLVAGHEEQDAGGEQLVHAQPLAPLGLGQAGEQVGLRCAPPLGDQPSKYRVRPPTAASADSRFLRDGAKSSRVSVRLLTHGRKRSRSSPGTPSSSAMVPIASG
jgi:hypothetical protein